MSVSVMVPLLVAVVAGACSLAASPLQRYLESREKRLEEKRKQYIRLLTSLVRLKSGLGDASVVNESIQSIYVIGSADVVKALDAFLCIFRDNCRNSVDQDKLYASLLIAIRKDLKMKRGEDFPGSLSITMFV